MYHKHCSFSDFSDYKYSSISKTDTSRRTPVRDLRMFSTQYFPTISVWECSLYNFFRTTPETNFLLCFFYCQNLIVTSYKGRNETFQCVRNFYDSFFLYFLHLVRVRSFGHIRKNTEFEKSWIATFLKFHCGLVVFSWTFLFFYTISVFFLFWYVDKIIKEKYPKL